MNFRVKNIIKFSHSWWIVIVIVSSMFVSCRSTKYVPENQYLLKDYKIEIDSRKFKNDELDNFVRQRPNKRILGVKFFLWVFNMSNIDKNNWINRSLRKIGEEPVIYDPFVTDRTSRQLKSFMHNKGFFNAAVSDTVLKNNQKARVFYRINANEPHRIRRVKYEIEDSTLVDLILSDTTSSLIRPNNIFDVDILQSERERIEIFLKNRGYYHFSREYVFFGADSTIGNRNIDITIGIKKYLHPSGNNEFELQPHPIYRINQVYVYMNYDPREALIDQANYLQKFDTITYENLHLLYKNDLTIKPRVIVQSTFLRPGEIFRQENVDLTYRNLFALRVFRLSNIRFREVQNEEGVPALDAVIQLTPFNQQAYTLEVEGINSSGDFGFGGNLLYENRNIFRGAEIFNMKLTGGFETLRETYKSVFSNTFEYRIESNLRIPKFLLPIRSHTFVQKYNPQTNFTLAYNYQRRPDYTRTIANFSIGYQWRGNRFTTHIVKPIEFNAVQLPFVTPRFLDLIRGTILEYSYQNHLISETNYSFIYNNQEIGRARDFKFFRFNLEFAGHSLAALYNLADAPKTDDSYLLFGNAFAQFTRADVDFRYYQYLNEGNSIVYRFFMGAGLPYGNSKALPFNKKYFSGGANSIRAWQVRSLGPGSYYEEADRSFPNRTADIKLEANLEYRFDMFWVIEGALFLDAGNIWAINGSDLRAGAVFRPGEFYKEIAIGTGLGTRFDFSFFVFRLDLGMKLRNPAQVPGNRWIPWDRKLRFRDDFVINIGIGYPF